MCNSKLATTKLYSPFYTKGRKNITKITIHHAVCVGATSMDIAKVFQRKQASCNYTIGNDGSVTLVVEECDTAWTSSSQENDKQAITIEVANCSGEPDWKISDKAWNTLIALCVDICKRNNITKFEYTGDKNGELTLHRMFAPTRCPGEYIFSRIKEIATLVNNQLIQSEKLILYTVQVGAFKSKQNAEKLVQELKGKGYSCYITKK